LNLTSEYILLAGNIFMNILVTGGAGYIGSVLCEELLKEDHKVVVLDNLQQGHRIAVPKNAEFISGDICNKDDVETVFGSHEIDAVMHLAAETVVESSVANPGQHFRCNVLGGINLLDAMLKYDVMKIVFSSSASV
jgi:UDP-glucose 4-epimerase